MYLQALNIIMLKRGYRQADLAHLAHVSRASVCKWFKTRDGICNVETRTLLRLAQGLRVRPEWLLTEPPDTSNLETRFLWDRLYPDMDSFILALCRGHLPALARLAQVLGINGARGVIGRPALTLFSRYKKHIKPVRRKILEELWPLYQSRR